MPNSRTALNISVLNGPIVKIEDNYGGLGTRYLETLLKNIDRIHQIDTITGITESNGSVRRRALILASELKMKGVQANDIILICSRSHADQTIVILAALLLLAIVAPLDPELNRSDTMTLINKLQPKICFCDLRALKQVDQILQECNIRSLLIHFGDEQQGAASFQKLMLIGFQKQYSNFIPTFIDDPRKNIAFIVQTQGATQSPKLVCLSHHFIYLQTLQCLEVCEFPDKIISFFNLSWIIQVILVCTCYESPLIRVLTGNFEERNACKIIHDLKVDCAIFGTFYAMKFAEHVAIKDFNLNCLKVVLIGGITRQSNVHQLHRLMPKIRFIQIYYTTEIGCPLASKASNYKEYREKGETVGQVLDNYTVKIVDIHTREALGPQCLGELLVKGEIMLGYLKDANLTKESMEGDFYKTGDLAKYDEGGWFYLGGRVEHLISKPGRTILPLDIENKILMHPFVKDVAVIGNSKLIVACVVVKQDTKLDATKLATFLADKLPEYQIPDRTVFMEHLPRTSTGKIKRNALKKEFLTTKIHRSLSVSS